MTLPREHVLSMSDASFEAAMRDRAWRENAQPQRQLPLPPEKAAEARAEIAQMSDEEFVRACAEAAFRTRVR